MLKNVMNYALECLQLLYWTIFKPFTLYRTLTDIHPDLNNPTAVPFGLAHRNPANTRLRRYANQMWWLAVLIPLLCLVLAGIETLVLDLLKLRYYDFNPWNALTFLSGWLLGMFVFRVTLYFLGDRSIISFIIITMSTIISVFGTISFVDLNTPRNAGLSSLFFAYFLSVFAFGNTTSATFSLLASSYILTFTLSHPTFTSNTILVIGMGSFSSLATSLITKRSFGIFEKYFVLSTAYILRLPFWFVECFWMLFLRLAVAGGLPLERALALVPPRFDQVIFLPLPFLTGLITSAIRHSSPANIDSHTYERAAIDLTLYLAESTTMQSTARKAMTELAIVTLARCQTFPDITQVGERLNWLPAPLPESVPSLVGDLLAINQDLRAADAATSAYYGSQLLNTAVQRLAELRQRAASSSHRADALTFSPIIERWQRLAQLRSEELAARVKAEGMIPPAFVAGPALDPNRAGNLFVGRRDIFRRIEQLTLAPQPPALLLFGGRRIGKTSAINMLPYRLPSDLIPLKLDGQTIATSGTVAGFVSDLIRQMSQAAQRLPPATKLVLPEPDRKALATDPFPALNRWMDRVEKIAGRRRLLLCFDEYERLEELPDESRTRILNFLRATIQHRAQWIVLLSGARTFRELKPYWSDYLINVTPIRISFLDPADAEHLLRQPIPDFPDIYEPGVVEAILAETNCHPYLVQLTGQWLVEHLNSRRRQRATLADLAAVFDLAIENDPFMHELWSRCSDDEKQALVTLARGLQLPASPAAESLRKRELIKIVNGHYQFVVPLFAHFVKCQT